MILLKKGYYSNSFKILSSYEYEYEKNKKNQYNQICSQVKHYIQDRFKLWRGCADQILTLIGKRFQISAAYRFADLIAASDSTDRIRLIDQQFMENGVVPIKSDLLKMGFQGVNLCEMMLLIYDMVRIMFNQDCILSLRIFNCTINWAMNTAYRP